MYTPYISFAVLLEYIYYKTSRDTEHFQAPKQLREAVLAYQMPLAQHKLHTKKATSQLFVKVKKSPVTISSFFFAHA